MAATVPSPDPQLPISDQRVHRELICSICCEFLREPRMLLCAHSFCAKCLSTLLFSQDKPGSKSESGGEPLKIQCPDCFQISTIQSISSLPVPSKFPDSIEELTDEQKEQTITSLKKRKEDLAAFEKDPSSLVTSQCPEHDQLLDHYCDDCGEVVCRGCIDKEHLSHSCSESVKFLLEDLSYLESLIQPAYQFAARAEQAVSQLSQDYDAIETNQNICTDAVQEVFNKLRSTIDQREKAILSTIEKYAETKLSQVKEYSQRLCEKRERIEQALATTERLVEEIYTIQIITEKEAIMDELDHQEQGILDIEEALFDSKFSSTYVGFKNDSTVKIQKEVSDLISLCEFYPDADSGYYLSRSISIEKEEDLYVVTTVAHKKAMAIVQKKAEDTVQKKAEDTVQKKSSGLKYSKSFHVSRSRSPYAHVQPIKEISEESEEDEDSYSHYRLGRRYSTPGIFNKSPTPDLLPPVPIRFDSLVAPTPILQPVKVFSKLGHLRSEVVNPCGVCIGENNSIILSDVRNHCLRIIASTGKLIDTVGKEGKGSGEFEEPCAIAADKNKHLLVLQRDNPRVQKLNSSGKYLTKFGQKSLRGNTIGEPWGIAVGPNKKIYVTDWDRSSIHVFNGNGKYDKTLNEESMQMLGDSLRFPAGIAIEANGNILVADRGSHCIWRLNQKGGILLKIGEKGSGPGELYLPYGVIICVDGSIAVSESGNNRISIFSPTGTFLKHFGRKGSEPGMFSHPRHMCVTKENELVVADELNERLQLFKF